MNSRPDAASLRKIAPTSGAIFEHRRYCAFLATLRQPVCFDLKDKVLSQVSGAKFCWRVGTSLGAGEGQALQPGGDAREIDESFLANSRTSTSPGAVGRKQTEVCAVACAEPAAAWSVSLPAVLLGRGLSAAQAPLRSGRQDSRASDSADEQDADSDSWLSGCCRVVAGCLVLTKGAKLCETCFLKRIGFL